MNSLRKKTFSAVRWTSASTFSRLIFGFAQLSILAHVLSPSDYGVMAMAIVIIGFASIFSDFGVGSSIVQSDRISWDQRDSLYWLSIIIGLFPAACVVLLSNLIASFYDNSDLIGLLYLGSVIFFVNAIGQQLKSFAEKDLNFKKLSIVEIISSFVGFSLSIFAALNDFGAYSIIIGSIGNSFASTCLAWTFLSNKWRPRLVFKYNDIKPFVFFGGSVVLGNIINQINSSVDILMGGKFLSVDALGLYSAPRNFLLQIQFAVNPLISRVCFPLIAKIQNNSEHVRSVFNKAINVSSSVVSPLYIWLIFFRKDFVNIFFGNKWIGIELLFGILAAWAGLRSLGNPIGGLVLGLGRADVMLRWNTFMLLIFFAAVWFGVDYGPEGVAWALLGVNVVIFFPGWYFLVFLLTGITFKDYFSVLARPIVLAFFSILAAYLLAGFFDIAILRILVGIVLSAIFYIMATLIFNKEVKKMFFELANIKL